MRRFTKKFLMPYIAASGYRSLCEIGSQGGDNLDRLLCLKNVQIATVDPCVDRNLEEKYSGNPRVRVMKGLSLEVLPEITEAFDCIMIDADHNWYSVYNELVLIHRRNLLAENGTLFLHDVCWPYARRDMYYDPANIPDEFKHPMAKRGIIRGCSALCAETSGGKNSELWNAQYEGGLRNGVLTAVEDFLREHPAAYDFLTVNREWGLGILTRRGRRPAGLAQLRLKAAIYNVLTPLKLTLSRLSGRLDYVR